MPISEKITNEIRQLDADKAFKEMMAKILKEEDDGLSQKAYKAEYKALVDEFIGKKEDNNESGSDKSDRL